MLESFATYLNPLGTRFPQRPMIVGESCLYGEDMFLEQVLGQKSG